MKKIVNYIILFVICLLPVMVDAKADIKFEKEFANELFLYEENNRYYFFNGLAEDQTEPGSVKIYKDNNEYLGDGILINTSAQSVEEFYGHKPFIEFYRNVGIIETGAAIIKEENYLYGIMFREGIISAMDINSGDNTEIDMEDDPQFSRKLLGKGYDLYLDYVDLGYTVNLIEEYDCYYVVDAYLEDEYDRTIIIYDNNLNKVLTFECEHNKYQAVYIYDNMIYVMNTNKILELYKLNGEKYQTFNITSEIIDNYENGCFYLSPYNMNIVGNKLFINYYKSSFGCYDRVLYFDVDDIVKDAIRLTDALTLEYTLDFDVNAITSTSGDFTYETTEEDGESYVELKVTPKDGYSVEEIIVTDINGNRIEVTNNKFIKPLNDVTVEVKYVKGEYLPIPDTFLNINIWSIIIGLLFVVAGGSTLLKNLYDNKIKE
ncbi:MAG: hypothetical protein IJ463_02455 [Bacilli bacterium]|nr:hypothetical protein [Bacilli bacterium]